MTIKELKEKIGTDRFIKISIILGFILLTVICYLNKLQINIEWDMIATIIGFLGVIITIKESEKSRVKQNKYDYKKEKITDEQIEFRRVVKEKVDLLDFAQVMQGFFHVDTTNYNEVIFKVNTYRTQVAVIENDIRWYYKNQEITTNSEVNKFLNLIKQYRYYYDKRLDEYNKVVLKLGALDIFNNSKRPDYLPSELKEIMSELNIKSKTPRELSSEIVNEQQNILMEIVKYRNENIDKLYKQAHLMVEERDNFMKKKLNNEN